MVQRREFLTYLGFGMGAIALSYGSNLLIKPKDMAIVLGAPPANAAQKLPGFLGISEWLNSNPLKPSDLKGSVILVQFWTFACINCQRTLPYVVQWHRKYANQGLKVIGVHTPEFPFERKVSNVKEALTKHQITYPVPLDNEFKTWNAFDNQYWPHLFLANRQGILVYDHIGEGAYGETEQKIRQLLN